MQVSASATMTQSSSNNYGSSDKKYAGMVSQSPIKVLRNHFFQLFTYLDSIVPNYYPCHAIISVWRILQFIGPCFCAAYSSIWIPGTIEAKGVSIISIFFHIVPVEYRQSSAAIVEFVYFAINLLFFVIITVSAMYYKKNAKLPNLMPSVISLYIHTFGYLIHPIALNLIGETIGRLIDGQISASSIVTEVVAVILVAICYAIWFWFFDQISVVSFLFRPDSLLTVLSQPQVIFFISTSLVTIITAVASQVSKFVSLVLTIIAAVLYLGGIWAVYMPGSFISLNHQRLIFTSSVTCCIFTVVMAIYRVVGNSASYAELFVFIAAFLIIYLVSVFLLRKRVKKQMLVLDAYHESTLTVEEFKKPGNLVSCSITGMAYAHPACIDWSIFRSGSDTWPESVDIWVTFGKFVAIYPNEDNLLSYIIHSMAVHKLKGNLAKQTIAQAKTISTQRESTLSPDLKVRLSRNAKQVQVTKRKLRHIWDLVIQGTINEMESSINNAYHSVNKTRSNFNHLLSQYPNNRFVARNYLRFLLEIEGDPQKYSEWSDKVKLLQRGMFVNADRTNLLGMHAFPGLPAVVNENSNTPGLTESESAISDIDMEDNVQTMNEQISVIRDRIDALRIPATGCIKAWSCALLVIFIYVPAIAMIVYAPNYLDSLTQPLEFMYHLSYLRSLTFQIPIFAHHYLCEEIGFFDIPLADSPPEAYGYEMTTDEQLRFLIKEATTSLESLSQFQTYNLNNEYVRPAHDIVFGGIINYAYYTQQIVYDTVNLTLQAALSDVSMQSAKLLDIIKKSNCSQNQWVCWNFTNNTIVLNPYCNFNLIATFISDALTALNTFLSNNATSTFNLILFICMFICICYVLVIIGILIYQLDSLEKCKRFIYKCLTALPKNVVSSVSESLRILKKDDDTSRTTEGDTELNKQEENILKIFASTSDASSMKSSEKTILIVLNVLILLCALAATIVIAQLFPSVTNKLRDNAPHLDYVLGASGYLFSVFGAVDNLVCSFNCHGLANAQDVSCDGPNTTLKEWKVQLVVRGRQRLETFINYYHLARYGGETTGEPPYSGFEASIQEADSKINCSDTYEVSTNIRDYYRCFKCDLQVNLFEPLITIMFKPVEEEKVDEIDPKDPIINELWNMVTIGLYNALFFPMFDQIVPEMKTMLHGVIPPARAGVICVLIIAFFVVVIILFEAQTSQAKMKFALSLLLHCPPSAVMQTSKIMEILSGDFSSKSKDVTLRNTEFFDSIVQSVPDSVIVCNQQYIVETINKATERIYGVTEADFVGKNVQDFFKSESFSSNAQTLFDKVNSTVDIQYQKAEGDKAYLQLSHNLIGHNYVVETRDQTQTICYNTLIAEERVKSDRLLSSILPPNLVKRVQDGEKNISFGVQSASILFLDIVEFTPWCASNTAAMVMSTLNNLFRSFDSFLATHSTMTKIKCIGDCYMAAGGIFVELNQPAVHAREVVEFGLESIHAVLNNNKEYDLNLRIRVGVNTGGPIVAGVLGTEKPTFEILGPAINMAQQMEHHGVPMKVHISRSVYELIYGGSFNVKERGQIEIKNGSVLTYLVEDKS